MSTPARFRLHGQRRLLRFLFPSQNDSWLTLLRIGLGLELLFYCLALQSDWRLLLSESGIIRRHFSEILLANESAFVPTISWLVAPARHLGLGEIAVLSIVWWLLLAAGANLVVGLFSRPSAITAWFLHLCAAKSGGLLTYGLDNFLTIGLFYLCLSPLPDRASLDLRLFGGRQKDRRVVGVFRRILQVHLCLIYFFSGLTKCLGSGWWDGSNIWRALTRPPFNILPPEVIAAWKYILPLAGISICVIELGYPLFIWLKHTRMLWLSLVCAMHVAIGLMMGMHLFALIMIVLNLAAFAPLKRLFRKLHARTPHEGRPGDLLSARR